MRETCMQCVRVFSSLTSVGLTSTRKIQERCRRRPRDKIVWDVTERSTQLKQTGEMAETDVPETAGVRACRIMPNYISGSIRAWIVSSQPA